VEVSKFIDMNLSILLQQILILLLPSDSEIHTKPKRLVNGSISQRIIVITLSD